MKYAYIRNPQLTQKALDYIFQQGRNTFDSMVNALVKEGKDLIKEGWMNKVKLPK
jgi:hypothetical protein